jgi:anaerobic ribonucleoside-triphosphate reductase
LIIDPVKLIDDYIEQTDWRIKENSNMSWSYQGMLGYIIGHNTAEYALQKVYSKEASIAHREGNIHIHDLSGLCNYCLGLDFEMFLMQGLDDGDGPPNHFSSALSMLHNLIQ